MPLSPRLLRPRTAVSAAFDPRNISGLRLWLDAADAASVTLNGSTVSAINDKSGNGRHATQATAISQPTFTANGLNSRSVLSFIGTQRMTGSLTGLSQPFAKFVVARANDTGANKNVFSFTATVNNNSTSLYFSPTEAPSIYSGSIISSATPVTSTVVLSAIFNGASSQLYANGSLVASGNPGSSTYTGDYNLGAFSGGFDPMQGIIAEVLVYDGTAASTRQQIERYLGAKWGITVA